MPEAEVLTRRWLRECVLALDLCPFAAPVINDQSLRIAVSTATAQADLLQDYLRELDLVQASGEQELSTTLLVFANGLQDFDEYLSLLERAQDLLDAAGLSGQLQLASFHPAYLFAAEAQDSLSHYTNRSPLPVIHILREAMLSRVLLHHPDPGGIPVRNIERLESMGRDAVEQVWRQLYRD